MADWYAELEYRNPSENAAKYWHVGLTDDGRVLTEWGRIGFAPQQKAYTYATRGQAKAQMEAKVAAKLKKGYIRKARERSMVRTPEESSVPGDYAGAPAQPDDFMSRLRRKVQEQYG